MGDYETSLTMKYEADGEATAEDNQSDKAGSTGSEGSEGFVKVDDVIDEVETLPTPVEEKPPKVDKPTVETLPSEAKGKTNIELAMLEHLDPQDDEFASEKCLRDYYDQLPTETAPFSVNEIVPDEATSPGGFEEVQRDTSANRIDLFQEEEKLPNFSPESRSSFPDSTSLMDHATVLQPSASGEPSEAEKSGSESSMSVQPDDTADIDLVGSSPIAADPKPNAVEDLEPKSEVEEVNTVQSEPDVTESEPLIETPKVKEVSFEPPKEEPVKAKPSTEEQPPQPKPIDFASHFKLSPGGDEKEDISTEEGDPAFSAWKERIVDLLYWRNVKASAVVFSLTLLILLSLCCYSVVSVIAYLALSLLTVTISVRLYKFVLQTLNGTQQPNPFQQLLDADIALSKEQVHKYADAILDRFNSIMLATRDLVLVKSVVSSLKFGVTMWLLTYIGCCFNGLTLLIIDVVLAFTLPPFYEKYQEPIDEYYGKAKSKIDEITALIRSKIPGSKAKTQ
ncbi:uncharacterized protein LOC143447488 isoform X2 [Clavelina lepadiformis]|uniref:uncharacterized protein LOC143447488 isoform X2 n=1 Tax=Clavelina lepadiformis TaxID=159417 RepID=UPI004042E7F7